MRGRLRSTGAGAAAALLALSMLVGCEEKAPEGVQAGPTAAVSPGAHENGPDPAPTTAAPSSAASVPASATPSASATADTAATSQEKAWCELSDPEVIVLRSDAAVPCEEVAAILADPASVNDHIGGDGDSPETPCAIVEELAPGDQEYATVVQCSIRGTTLMTQPSGSAPLDGFLVDRKPYSFSSDGVARYSFRVPDSDYICSLVSSEDGGRGVAGCHGTFDSDARAENHNGELVQASTIEAVEGDTGFSAYGDGFYMPTRSESSKTLTEAPELPVGAVIAAYGVVCQSLPGGAVSCTAGPTSRMTASATEHEIRK